MQGEEVRIKKYFYVIRPLLAAKWVVDKKTQPPMLFSELLEAELPVELRGIIDNLLEMKQCMPEMGFASKKKELVEFIERELVAVKQAADDEAALHRSWDLLDDYFNEQVMAGI